MDNTMYLQGFGNCHQTEALEGALPPSQNAPQKCPLGLYAEQISGSAFSTARHQNLHSWLYRLLPSAAQGLFKPYNKTIIQEFTKELPPNPLRWSPRVNPTAKTDFIEGLFHFAGNALAQVYLYYCNESMDNTYFSSHDGELLFIPYQGEIQLKTEMGVFTIKPETIGVIPRGVKFKVELLGRDAAGYLCENLNHPLSLPELGILGANGLANPRHFNYPKAAFEKPKDSLLLCKYQDKLWFKELDHSPLNVVAWHGNYAPYLYDLNLFNTINTVSFDHPDPSIFTVLTSESDRPKVANLDFVIFPERWMVAEHSFRLPYFHRNVMSELMGLIKGHYDAKEQGFLTGGISIHNCMTAHGPDKDSYEQAIREDLKPEKYTNTLAFMLESRLEWQVTNLASGLATLQEDYAACWNGLKASTVSV